MYCLYVREFGDQAAKLLAGEHGLELPSDGETIGQAEAEA